jgi:hypothetical protein
MASLSDGFVFQSAQGHELLSGCQVGVGCLGVARNFPAARQLGVNVGKECFAN